MSHLTSQAHGETVPQQLLDLAQPHIDSFDYFLGEGMEHVVENLEGIEVRRTGGRARSTAPGAHSQPPC
jgi:hypothetical protein